MDIGGVRDLASMGPNNAIISNSCDYVETQVEVLIEFCLSLSKILSTCSCVYSLQLRFSHLWPLLIRSYYDFFIASQSMPWRQFIVESRPKTNWVGVYCVVVCTVALQAKMMESNIPSLGFLSINSMSYTLKVRGILLIVWCTLSSIAFAWGFLGEIGFTFMI